MMKKTKKTGKHDEQIGKNKKNHEKLKKTMKNEKQ
jgi:phage-related protein